MTSATMQVQQTDHETVFTRILTAPREQVFHAWTRPRQLAQWWGPHGFTVPVCDVDLRPGGTYRLVLRSSDGKNYPIGGRYLEIEPPRRLLMTGVTDDHPPEWHEQLRQYRGDGGEPVRELRWQVDFELHPAGTRLSISTRFPSPQDLQAFMKMGMADGWAQSLDKLQTLLTGASASPA